ncbi:MAG: uracil-DNA glycosylase family protein [Kordiimonadaceae bacterium]|nr:uracil-DNA glycosylase family protein [Kordiimonadaceae bacterium]
MSLADIVTEARACTVCATHLAHPPRPIMQASTTARILIAGQAPGRKVQESGIPFDDASGNRLRDWMGIDKTVFYDPSKISILPMGFCYPGTGKSGDLPPRPECAPLWRTQLLAAMPDIQLTLVIGQYALAWHMPNRPERTLTETVKNWRDYAVGGLLPLPHPSPRNNIWMAKNEWFSEDVLPTLKNTISQLLKP